MKIIFYTLSTIVLLSCKSNSITKDENIPWIKERIETLKNHPFPKKTVITTYKYDGETVYLVESCYQCPDAQSFLYNSKKEKLCTFGGMIPNTNNCPDFFDVATDKKTLWKNF